MLRSNSASSEPPAGSEQYNSMLAAVFTGMWYHTSSAAATTITAHMAMVLFFLFMRKRPLSFLYAHDIKIFLPMQRKMHQSEDWCISCCGISAGLFSRAWSPRGWSRPP